MSRERRSQGQVAGNNTSCKHSVHGQTEKGRNLQTDRKPHFGVVSIRKAAEDRGKEKGMNPQHLNVICCSLCPHYSKITIKLALQIKSYHHAPMP